MCEIFQKVQRYHRGVIVADDWKLGILSVLCRCAKEFFIRSEMSFYTKFLERFVRV